MKFIDIFSGIGGFRHGLEKSGHICVGHVEIDKFANQSYMAMYDLKECKFKRGKNENSCMVCHLDIYKNCDGKECNGEWYGKDIKQIKEREIPKAEIWTFGFPCTDISISNNKRLGLSGERSRLFFEVIRLLKGKDFKDRPQWLIVENVKHLLSVNAGGDFTTVLYYLSQVGYDTEWSVENSKNYGVPQNRERIFIVGRLRGRGGGKIFPIKKTTRGTLKQIVKGTQSNRIYDISGTSVTLTALGGGFGGNTALYIIPNFIDLNKKYMINNIASCITTKRGISNFKGDISGVISKCFCKYCGKSNCVSVKEITDNSKYCKNHRFNEDIKCCRIRKLTPRECFRLQAFEDNLYEKVKSTGISDTQLYKQAGNAITTNIAYQIGLKLAEQEGGINK